MFSPRHVERLLEEAERWEKPDVSDSKAGEASCEKLMFQEEKFYMNRN